MGKKKQRNKDGTFRTGHKPLKKTGTRHFNGLKEVLKTNEKSILQAVIDQAMEGKNPTAMQFILNKMYGKAPLSGFSLGDGTPQEAIKQVIAAMGTEAPETLASAIKLIRAQVEVADIAALQKDVKELKEITRGIKHERF